MSPSPTTAPRVWQDSDLLNGSGMFQLRSLVSAKVRPSDYGADTSASWADMDTQLDSGEQRGGVVATASTDSVCSAPRVGSVSPIQRRNHQSTLTPARPAGN